MVQGSWGNADPEHPEEWPVTARPPTAFVTFATQHDYFTYMFTYMFQRQYALLQEIPVAVIYVHRQDRKYSTHSSTDLVSQSGSGERAQSYAWLDLLLRRERWPVTDCMPPKHMPYTPGYPSTEPGYPSTEPWYPNTEPELAAGGVAGD